MTGSSAGTTRVSASTPDGMSMDTDAPAGEATMADLLLDRVGDEHLGLLFEDQRWTWHEIVDEASVRARLLAGARRDGPFHIGVLLENLPEYLFLLGGAALAGAVVVGINPTRRGEELAADIRHTDCQLILTDRTHRPLLDGLDLGVAPDRVWEVDGADHLERLAGATAGETSGAVSPDDLYLLLFTSGSAGAPKAVRMTHRRAVRSAQSLICARDSVPYCAMPLFHGNALAASVLPAMRAGATIALRRKFSASAFLDDVRTHGCTYFSAIGRVLSYILATPEQPDDRDNPLQFVLGPESSQGDMARFEERFGCPVFSGYGSSENAIILMPAPGAPKSALGVPAEGQDVAIIDPDTRQECPRARVDEGGRILNFADAVGEIVGRNTLPMFEGYYKNDLAMAERSRDGWYWSGDLGYRDEQGVFWFAGRTADWIRVDGENFATAPVERILGRFPGVRGVAVYGVPDERNAEDQVMAAIELDDRAAFDPEAFEAFLAAQPDLGTKWAPRYVRVVPALPVTGTDKIDKKPLRAEGWVTTDRVWWKSDRREAYRPLTETDAEHLRLSFEASGRAALLAKEPGRQG
jgi:fatty-acyl-CoA synthase